MIVTRNLYNGLVNGLTATILSIENDKIHIEIAVDEHLQHGMERKIFEIEKYSEFGKWMEALQHQDANFLSGWDMQLLLIKCKAEQ